MLILSWKNEDEVMCIQFQKHCVIFMFFESQVAANARMSFEKKVTST